MKTHERKYDKQTFLHFISFYKGHLKLFIASLIAAVLLAAIELVYPLIATRIVDSYIPNSLMRELLTSMIVLVILYIIMSGLNYFLHYWGHVLGIRIEADMRLEFFTHIQKLPFKFFDDNRTGNLMSRIVNDLNLITELAHHGPEDLLISTAMFAGSFVVLFNKEWRLTLLIYLVLIPLMIIFSITQRNKMSAAFKNVRERTADINSQLENSIAGIRVAKAYTNEEYEIERFNEGNCRFRSAKKDAYHKMAYFMTGMGFLISMLNVITLGLGGYLTYSGAMTLGELFGFLLYINLVMIPIRRLTNFTQQFEEGMNGFIRFEEIMRIEPEITDGKAVLKDAKGHIKFEDVSFQYTENETVLKNISLAITSGTTVALVGPSGGGKTTLCHLIPRFYDVREGMIRIDGHDIKDYTLNSLRSNIGLVSQDVFLFTGTIKDNILYGRPGAPDNDIEEAAKNANIFDFICSLPNGFDTWIGEKGIKLSGGQKQRISIARVFLKNPPILLLDEATSSLDNQTEIEIQKSLVKLSKGRTTLIIAHRLSTIRNADMIVVLTDEGIMEKGSHKELYAKNAGMYKRLYDAQFYAEEHKADNIFATEDKSSG